jgi:hypothetical protein
MRHLSKRDKSDLVDRYLSRLDAATLTGITWRDGSWTHIHGTFRSSTKTGSIRLESMCGIPEAGWEKSYLVRIIHSNTVIGTVVLPERANPEVDLWVDRRDQLTDKRKYLTSDEREEYTRLIQLIDDEDRRLAQILPPMVVQYVGQSLREWVES